MLQDSTQQGISKLGFMIPQKAVLKAIVLVVFFLSGGSLNVFGQQENMIQIFDLKIDSINAELSFATGPFKDTNCYYYLNNDSIQLVPEKKQVCNFNWTIPLVQGYNSLKIFLNDSVGSTFSCDTTIYINSRDKKCGYWVLSVGTGDKTGVWSSNLTHSTEDAKKFVNSIIEKFGQPEMPPIILNDSRATKKGIEVSFDSILMDIKDKNSIQDKAVVVYLSGHGQKEGDKTFRFQVKNDKGMDTEWLTEDSLVYFINKLVENEDVMVWLFVDACESIDLFNDYKNTNNSIVFHGKIIRYSSQIKQGENYYCNTDPKECKEASEIIHYKEDNGNLEGKAIDGLFEHIFKLSLCDLSIPTTEENLMISLFKKSGEHFTPPHKINISADDELYFPVKEPEVEKPSPSGFIDFAIGWNFSGQWNPQIGYSWEKWSVFANISFNFNWTNDITHTLRKDEIVEIIPSKRIRALGAGFKWYPISNKKIDYGFVFSAQIGDIYGEKFISETETILHHQSFSCFKPAFSMRWFTSKRHLCMCNLDIGYAWFTPNSINKDVKWRSAVVNIGLSIPICHKNKNSLN